MSYFSFYWIVSHIVPNIIGTVKLNSFSFESIFILKAMRKYWNKLGLRNQNEELLLMAACLALTSADRFDEGIKVLRNTIKRYQP